MFKIKLISGIAGVKSGFLADKLFEKKTIFLIEDAFDETRKLNIFSAQKTEAEGKVAELEKTFVGSKFELIEVEVAAAGN